MKKPVIGIVLDLVHNNPRYSYAQRPWYALRRDYSDSVIQAGGLPIMIPYEQEDVSDSFLNDIMDLVDGLVIAGGDEDIHPNFYGQEIISDKVKTNNTRAKFELALLKKVLDQDIPVLGICNGMQLINVLCGGTLIQHLPDVIQGNINHEQPPPKHLPSHSILIEKNTILASLSQEPEVMVNSTHHQAVDKIGDGLVVSAYAPDGVIEAIESKNHKFLIGVEWHAEYLNSELDKNLFKKLIEESSTSGQFKN